MLDTYVISNLENVGEVVTHASVIHGHEARVQDDAQSDEEINKRIHDEQLDDVSEALPACAAFPVKQQLMYT